MPRVFLLSPAHVGGLRAAQLLNPQASFPLARQFRREGLPLGVVFTFLSALYFRGKLAYAQHFTRVETGDVVRVITTNQGLVDPAMIVTPKDLLAFGTVDIDDASEAYRRPLKRDARALSKKTAPDGQVVLLGSIATAKYREVLLECFGSRLVFPKDFVGRGDMSRGGLLLRAVKSGEELEYQTVAGAILHGKRAQKLNTFRQSAGERYN
ncbi:MAG: hypothetical protein K0R17_2098 [Rariglobus sp.]|nr:hypothetical protein [Rariglobus sp.]